MYKRIGIDIGGTTIKGALFCDNELIKLFTISTEGKAGREKILNNVFKVIDNLNDSEVNFIGIASAGNINIYTGEVVYATDNLKGWTGVNLINEITGKYNIKCLVENDAVAALFGELLFIKKCKNITMLTLGTGCGGASIVDGKVLRGENFDGGRWGHLCLEENGRKCNCGKRGCAEQYVSATALLNSAKETMPDINEAKDVFELYRKGDKSAVSVINNYAQYFNKLLFKLEKLLNPEIIILGGGLIKSQDIFSKIIDKKIKNIKFARLGSNAGIYGAAFALNVKERTNDN